MRVPTLVTRRHRGCRYRYISIRLSNPAAATCRSLPNRSAARCSGRGHPLVGTDVLAANSTRSIVSPSRRSVISVDARSAEKKEAARYGELHARACATKIMGSIKRAKRKNY